MLMAVNGPYVLTVQHDDFFPNPRRDGENFGTMTCFHRRYQIGDEHKYFCSDDLLEDLFIKAAGGGEKGKQKYDALRIALTFTQVQRSNCARSAVR